MNSSSDRNSRKISAKSISNHVALNAILAASTQVAAQVKPGNVHRYNDFNETKMEHYISSAVALNNPMFELAQRGIMVERGLIDMDEVDMGWIIAEAAKDNVNWHTGGMTNLGMLFLFSPIALASGYLISKKDEDKGIMDVTQIPKIAKMFLENTTPEDTVNILTMLHQLQSEVYKISNSILISLPESISDVLEDEVRLFDFYQSFSSQNLIFNEISNGYKNSFGYGFAAFEEAINEGTPMIDAICHTYVTLLSLNPDSMVLRKYGKKQAFTVMQKAKNIMENGGFLTSRGRLLTYDLDKELQSKDKSINPGVIADLTANVTFLATLDGIRP